MDKTPLLLPVAAPNTSIILQSFFPLMSHVSQKKGSSRQNRTQCGIFIQLYNSLVFIPFPDM